MANIKCKDSVFSKMFGQEDKKYLLQLYQSLHPEDHTVSVDALHNVTIENILLDGMYNDLGFMVEDRLVVLVEAQSTWSENIIVRLWLYLAKTYQEYINKNDYIKGKLYTSSKIELPMPELYVLYTGKGKNRPNELSLRESFFQNGDFGLELKAKVITSDKYKEDIIGQYISFCQIYDEQRKAFAGDKRKIIDETIKICLDQGILFEYLSEHKKEVEDTMLSLITQEEATYYYGQMQRNAAYEEYREQLQEQSEQLQEQSKQLQLKDAEIERLKAQLANR